jgi:hypothetical protein
MPLPRSRNVVPLCVAAGKLEGGFAEERRHLDRAAERRERELDRDLAEKIVTLPLEQLVVLDREARCRDRPGSPPATPASPLPTDRRREPVSTPGRNAHVELGRLRHAPLAPTGVQGFSTLVPAPPHTSDRSA